MLKTVFDFLWIISSMSPYLLFFKLSNIDAKEPINIFNNIQYGNTLLQTDYFVTAIVAFSSILFLQIYKWIEFKKANDSLTINSIKIAGPIYIPVYITYFVIAINISNLTTFIWVSIILFLLISTTKVFYFNPILLLFGYHFYEIQDTNDTCLLLISKKNDLKGKQSFEKLYRLNNFTFLDTKGD